MNALPSDHGPNHRRVDCSEVVLRVFEYIDAETTPEDGERIRIHLSACRECLDEYERDVLLKALVRRSCSGEPAPTGLRAQIMASITTVRIEHRADSAG